jgi:hypothetical protein
MYGRTKDPPPYYALIPLSSGIISIAERKIYTPSIHLYEHRSSIVLPDSIMDHFG